MPVGPRGVVPRRPWRGLRARFGGLPVARVFSPGLPPARWADVPVLAALGAGTDVVYSFSGDLDALAAGASDALLTGFLRSRPDGVRVWVALKHEPEDDAERGAFTAEQFRAATEHVAGVVRAAGGVPTTVLQAYTLNPASGRDWHDWVTPAVDVVAWDAYNTAARRPQPSYPPPDAFLRRMLEVARETGKPFGVAELGSPCVRTDPGCTGRAAWLTDLGGALRAAGAQFVTYWDRPALAGGVDYRLDAPGTEAWRRLPPAEAGSGLGVRGGRRVEVADLDAVGPVPGQGGRARRARRAVAAPAARHRGPGAVAGEGRQPGRVRRPGAARRSARSGGARASTSSSGSSPSGRPSQRSGFSASSANGAAGS